MNALDLFVLGVCEGAGTRDYHSGRYLFESEGALRHVLAKLGLLGWWEREVRVG